MATTRKTKKKRKKRRKETRPRVLDRGVDATTIYMEWADLCKQAKLARTPVMFTEDMDLEHYVNRRRYASVEVDSGVLVLAKAFRRLSPEHRLGVYAHEIGHRYMIEVEKKNDHTEEEADAAAVDALGVEIVYDMRWPGKGLQRALRAPEEVWLIVDPVGVMLWYPERVKEA